MTFEEFFRAKTPMPTALRTEELAYLPLAVREQAYFMATVQRADILSYFREAAQQILDGKMNYAEATRIIREGLKASGYKPVPGQEGTIKDLNTLRRQMINLRTNVGLAAGYAREVTMRKGSKAFPAARLVRGGQSEEPRRWSEKIWPESVQPSGSGASESEMVALLDDPIWVYMSDFNAPYTPLRWGSKMEKLPVGFTEAKRLGLLKPKPAAEPAAEPQIVEEDGKPKLPPPGKDSPPSPNAFVYDAKRKQFLPLKPGDQVPKLIPWKPGSGRPMIPPGVPTYVPKPTKDVPEPQPRAIIPPQYPEPPKITKEPATPAEMPPAAPPPSLNSTLETTTRLDAPAMQKLEEDLGGYGIADGNVMMATDPHGTRAWPLDILAGLMQMPTMDGDDNQQAKALREWDELGGDEAAIDALREKHDGKGIWYDFQRLLRRIPAIVSVVESLKALAAAL